MKVEVKRLYKKPEYTVGKLYVDGEYICDTLEDVDRGLTQSMNTSDINRIKVKGSTAIPTGNYVLSVSARSPRFGNMKFYQDTCNGRLPRLMSVPCFEGVLIHVGTNVENTQGCILVGYNKAVGRLVRGKDAFVKLWDKIKDSRDLSISIH